MVNHETDYDMMRFNHSINLMIGWHIRRDELVDVMNDKTKAIILNNPHNPTGEKGEKMVGEMR